MERFCKFGKLHAIKGNGHKLLSILLTASKELEDVDNCFCYIVGQDENDLDAVYVYEVWEDKEAHKQSLDQLVINRNNCITGRRDTASNDCRTLSA